MFSLVRDLRGKLKEGVVCRHTNLTEYLAKREALRLAKIELVREHERPPPGKTQLATT